MLTINPVESIVVPFSLDFSGPLADKHESFKMEFKIDMKAFVDEFFSKDVNVVKVNLTVIMNPNDLLTSIKSLVAAELQEYISPSFKAQALNEFKVDLTKIEEEGHANQVKCLMENSFVEPVSSLMTYYSLIHLMESGILPKKFIDKYRGEVDLPEEAYKDFILPHHDLLVKKDNDDGTGLHNMVSGNDSTH